MKITDALLGEHGVFYAMFERIETLLAEDAAAAPRLASLLESALAPHAAIENDHLFAALDPVMGPGGPLAVMRAEHDTIERALGGACRAEDPQEAKNLLLSVIDTARDHFAKEEQVLFPMARQALGDDRLEQLNRAWADRRRVQVG